MWLVSCKTLLSSVGWKEFYYLKFLLSCLRYIVKHFISWRHCFLGIWQNFQGWKRMRNVIFQLYWSPEGKREKLLLVYLQKWISTLGMWLNVSYQIHCTFWLLLILKLFWANKHMYSTIPVWWIKMELKWKSLTDLAGKSPKYLGITQSLSQQHMGQGRKINRNAKIVWSRKESKKGSMEYINCNRYFL